MTVDSTFCASEKPSGSCPCPECRSLDCLAEKVTASTLAQKPPSCFCTQRTLDALCRAHRPFYPNVIAGEHLFRCWCWSPFAALSSSGESANRGETRTASPAPARPNNKYRTSPPTHQRAVCRGAGPVRRRFRPSICRIVPSAQRHSASWPVNHSARSSSGCSPSRRSRRLRAGAVNC